MFGTRIGVTADGKFFIDSMPLEKKKRENKGASILARLSDFTALDVETTGLSPEYDSIIEIAAVKYRNNLPVDRFSQLIYPGCSLDEFITGLTGITDDMLSGMPPIDEVLPTFMNFIGNDIVIGHNAHFDINFIYDNCVNSSLPAFENDFIDTMRIAKRLYKGWESYKLDDLIENLGLETRGIHRALNDAELTAKAYVAMCANPNFEAAIAPPGKKAKDFTAEEGRAEEDNPLFGKICVFTGALQRFNRAEAMQIVTNIGGICADGVTRKTNFLILGNSDYLASSEGEKSSKQKKAEKLKLSGIDIEIIPENVFYDMLESYFDSQNNQ